ncbi:hypothetical protein ZEAMMB73_Zm00001d052849 [Zea mays]|uniref:Uncharacterized protein n=1 Tax=Zea mays TaxID=4577 RepID=K7U4E7_MAIZE|nr:hypothetical protein ZEAMMB73_Zm00001d052849 [Zea mays]
MANFSVDPRPFLSSEFITMDKDVNRRARARIHLALGQDVCRDDFVIAIDVEDDVQPADVVYILSPKDDWRLVDIDVANQEDDVPPNSNPRPFLKRTMMKISFKTRGISWRLWLMRIWVIFRVLLREDLKQKQVVNKVYKRQKVKQSKKTDKKDNKSTRRRMWLLKDVGSPCGGIHGGAASSMQPAGPLQAP